MSGPSKRASWQEAFDAQMETWRWVRTPMGKDWVKARIDQMMELDWNVKDISTDGDEALVEEDILLRADPFFVSEEMSIITAAACESFTMHEPLLPSDLLASHGFVYFERGLPLVPGLDGKPGLPILGLSWGTNTNIPGERMGIFPTFYSDWPTDWIQPRPEFPSVPRLIPTPLPVWEFGQEPPRLRDGFTFQYIVIQVVLKLLAQFVPHSRYSHREHPDRIVRREAKKLVFPERDVVVVRLRRERSQHEPTGEKANYSHRFLVSGHWRNQWYPSARLHRQKWISPYVKGDESLPLRARKRRAFVLNR